MDSTQLWTYLVWVLCGIVALLAVAFLVRVVHRAWRSAEESAQEIARENRRSALQGMAGTDCFPGDGRALVLGTHKGKTRLPVRSEEAGQ